MIMIGLFLILLTVLFSLMGVCAYNSAVNCMDTSAIDAAAGFFFLSTISGITGVWLFFLGLDKMGWLF